MRESNDDAFISIQTRNRTHQFLVNRRRITYRTIVKHITVSTDSEVRGMPIPHIIDNVISLYVKKKAKPTRQRPNPLFGIFERQETKKKNAPPTVESQRSEQHTERGMGTGTAMLLARNSRDAGAQHQTKIHT
jgi:hypothetical protein